MAIIRHGKAHLGGMGGAWTPRGLAGVWATLANSTYLFLFGLACFSFCFRGGLGGGGGGGGVFSG